MMNVEALKELAAKIEAGVKYEKMGHTMLCQKAFPKPEGFDGSRESYEKSDAQMAILAWRNGDLNAAKALHDAVLPGWTLNGLWEKRHSDNGQHPTGVWVCLLFGIVDGKYHGPDVTAKDPARAWLLAILRALISQAKAEHK